MSYPRDAHERIQAEIAREKTGALGRAGERLEAALGRVDALGRRLDATADPEGRARLLGEYEDARARALHARLALVIQREANGLRHHRVVEEQFPAPPPRAGGPRPDVP